MPRTSKQKPATQAVATPPRVPVEYVTAREAAAYLGLALPTLSLMRQTRTGPPWCRVSPRRVVYEIQALRDYMAARVVNPNAA